MREGQVQGSSTPAALRAVLGFAVGADSGTGLLAVCALALAGVVAGVAVVAEAVLTDEVLLAEVAVGAVVAVAVAVGV